MLVRASQAFDLGPKKSFLPPQDCGDPGTRRIDPIDRSAMDCLVEPAPAYRATPVRVQHADLHRCDATRLADTRRTGQTWSSRPTSQSLDTSIGAITQAGARENQPAIDGDFINGISALHSATRYGPGAAWNGTAQNHDRGSSSST